MEIPSSLEFFSFPLPKHRTLTGAWVLGPHLCLQDLLKSKQNISGCSERHVQIMIGTVTFQHDIVIQFLPNSNNI